VDRRVGADDVVVRQDVGEAELVDSFAVGAKRADLTAELGLGEHDTDAHVNVLLGSGP
jgi:hypothetical protein